MVDMTPQTALDAARPLSISVQKAAELTSLSEFSIYEEVYAGRLKAKRLGRRWLIDFTDFEAWYAALPSGVPEPV